MLAGLMVAAQALPAPFPDGNALIRKTQRADRDNWPRILDYEYHERIITKHLDGGGRVEKIEQKAHEVLFLEGSPYRKLLEKDGKPLSEAEARFEEDKLKAVAEERRRETPEQRRKRSEEAQRARERNRAALREVPDAFNFRVIGEETVNGRKTWVTWFEPRPGYSPRDRRAKIFPHLKGKLYIDQEEFHWVRAEAELFDTFSFGWILVRVHQGSRAVVEQTRTPEGLWVQSRIDLQADARVGLFKHYRIDQQILYTGFRKPLAETARK